MMDLSCFYSYQLPIAPTIARDLFAVANFAKREGNFDTFFAVLPLFAYLGARLLAYPMHLMLAE